MQCEYYSKPIYDENNDTILEPAKRCDSFAENEFVVHYETFGDHKSNYCQHHTEYMKRIHTLLKSTITITPLNKNLTNG